MDAGAIGRIWLAAAVAGCALAAGTGLVALADVADSRAPGDELEPDLFVERPDELYLTSPGAQTFLRVSNTVSNRGAGPLEMTGNGTSCEDGDGRFTLQRVYKDSATSPGVFERADDEEYDEVEAGCSRYHPAHDHWHFDNFARYTLLREKTGNVVGNARKVSFCVLDTGRPYPGLPGSPDEGYYPQDPGAEYPTCSQTSVDGLSIGWEDTYGASLPGQGIKVSGLRRGFYCLVLETDPPGPGLPDGVLAESDETNNARTIRLRMRVHKLLVRRLGPDCKSSLPG